MTDLFVRSKARIHGSDKSEEMTLHTLGGEVLARVQIIEKDRVRYWRESIDGNPDKFGPWKIQRTDMPGRWLPCLELPEPGDAGPHYVYQDGPDHRVEVWLDAGGRPEYRVDTIGEDREIGYRYTSFGGESGIEAPDVP